MVAIPLAFGGCVMARPLIELIFGRAYVDAAPATSVVVLSAVFVIPGWIMVATAYALGQERKVALIWGVALVGNGLANAFVIPAFGIVGAASASLVASAFTFIGVRFLLSRAGVATSAVALAGKPVLAGAVMVAVVWPLRGASTGLAIAVGGIVYLVVLLLLRPFTPEDRTMIRTILRPRAGATDD